MRLKRGTLAGRKVEGRWVVLVPRSNADRTASEREDLPRETVTQRPTERPTQYDDEQASTTRELLDVLRSENAYLRSLLDAEVEARRRADHLVAGLMERLPELTAGDAPEHTVQHDPQEAVPRPRAEPPAEPSEPAEIPNWRRWLRRVTGG